SILALCTRPSDNERANIDMRALLRTSLRLRPDLITMAEMRGAEALDAQEAARTGHTVTSTLHANSAAQAFSWG
ncbi:MAG: ATPase, T2SS/T4P/T4SS family, partial [Clostridia bacterium]